LAFFATGAFVVGFAFIGALVDLMDLGFFAFTSLAAAGFLAGVAFKTGTPLHIMTGEYVDHSTLAWYMDKLQQQCFELGGWDTMGVKNGE